MKLLGVLAGMSWESTAVYYRTLNTLARAANGGQSSARLVMWSVDFGPMAQAIARDDWDPIREELVDAARKLRDAGAEAIVIATNTMHKFADEIEAAAGLPLIHIGDAAADALIAKRRRRPLLLATRATMEGDFLVGRLQAHGLQPIIPHPGERLALNAVIFDELIQGVFSDASREYVRSVVRTARARDDIDSVILGCTEFGLLTPPDSYDLPAIDTALAHCDAAMKFALS